MRLRQIALASRDLGAVTRNLEAAFGMKVAFTDPQIAHYGLRNAVLPAGTGFIEIVEPISSGASAGRFLDRRGGDAGYMLIFQTADAAAERARVAGLGVRVVDDIDRPDYRAAHFHPNDFGGVLTSIDQQRTIRDHLEPFGDWWPAGPAWREALSDDVQGLSAVVMASSSPEVLAARWSELLGHPLDSTDRLRLPLERGELRFVRANVAGTVIRQIDLKVSSRSAALARARRAELAVTDQGALIGGVHFCPVD